MRVVHESADADRGSTRGRSVLAADVETADSPLSKTVGLMGRTSVPDDYALVFQFEPGLLERGLLSLPRPLSALGERARRRDIHMLFVRTPIDVVWIEEAEVVKVRTLDPWRGRDSARADTVIELAAGAADGVEPGDRVLVETESDATPDE
jgi:uncharacterized membrane protein (UPF0127 family)